MTIVTGSDCLNCPLWSCASVSDVEFSADVGERMRGMQPPSRHLFVVVAFVVVAFVIF